MDKINSNVASESLLSQGSMIMGILYRGFGREALHLAEGEGAQGVTFLHGTGHYMYTLAQPFNAETANRKEIVLVVCPPDVASRIMLTWQRVLGLQSPAKGIFLELPVHYGVGLVGRKILEMSSRNNHVQEEMDDVEGGTR